MPYLSDKCNEVRSWLALGSEVYPDLVVTGWIRMAEEFLSNALRVKHMIQIDTSLIVDERVPLPRDWQEIRMVRVLPSKGALRYNTPDAFFNPEFPEDPDDKLPGQKRRYTVLGNYLYVGGAIAPGIQVEMTYYQDIPPLTEESNNWINYYHPTIYTLKILHIAALYSIEDERAANWNQEVANLATIMNTRHQIDKASGSVLAMTGHSQSRRKTFG